MATGDMVARLVLDGKEFELSLKKAKKGVEDFDKSTNKAGDGFTRLVGTVKKFAAAVGAIEASRKLFDAWVNNTQANTDKWGRTVQAAQAVWDNFTRSLFSGDWSAWEGGIGAIVEKAEELYNALDKLKNIELSVDFFSTNRRNDIKNALLVARDDTRSYQERSNALSDARTYVGEFKSSAERQRTAAIDAIRAFVDNEVNLSGGFMSQYITEDLIREVLEGYAKGLTDAEQKIIRMSESDFKSRYDSLKASLEDINKKNARNREPYEKLLEDMQVWIAQGWRPNERRLIDLDKDFKEFDPSRPVGLKKPATIPYTSEDYNRDADWILEQFKTWGDLTLRDVNEEMSKDYAKEVLLYALLGHATNEEREQVQSWFTGAVDKLNEVVEYEQNLQEVSKALKTSIENDAAAKEKYAQLLKEYPWSTSSSAAKLTALFGREFTGLTGNFTPANIADFGREIGMRSNLSLSVPRLSEYGGKYGFWKFNENPIQRTGGLEAMTALPFDAEALKQLVADDELMAWAAKNREEFDKWGTSLNLLGGAFSSLGASIGGASGELFTFVGGLIDAAQQMLPFIAQIMAETTAREANATAATTEAAAKSMSAYAGIPIAGIGLGLAAVAAIVGAVQSVPKFADGGIVTSATLGVFGEAGPEAVMPLDRLEEFVTGRDVRVTGNIKASGKELVVVLDNYNRVRNG